jgi:hypothetical protein
VTNATGVTWKRAVDGPLDFPVADTFGLLFRDPFEFVETDNATKSSTDKPKTMELARRQASSSSEKQRSLYSYKLLREADARPRINAEETRQGQQAAGCFMR